MAETVIGTTIAGTISTATGRGHQGHIQWGANDSAWWLFYFSSTDTTHILTQRSPDETTWTAKSSSLFASSEVHNNDAMGFAVHYTNKASVDVFHSDFGSTASQDKQHNRGTTASAAITWGGWAIVGNGNNVNKAGGQASAYSTDDFPYAIDCAAGNINANKASNADAGTSWTAGFGASTALDQGSSVAYTSVHGEATTTNRIVMVWDDGGNATTFTSLLSRNWDGTTLSSQSTVGTTGTAQDKNDWGMCRVSDTDTHVVFRTGSNTFTHKRWNGTNWTSSSGASIPNQNHLAGSGIALSSDGTSVWMFIIDTDAANTVRYIKWNGTAWDAQWTALETTTKTRNYISCCPTVNPNNKIGVIWTETNGGNFDIAFEALALPAVATPYVPGSFTIAYGNLVPLVYIQPSGGVGMQGMPVA